MIDIETIFRSIIYIRTDDGKETISQKDCVENFRNLQKNVPNPPEEKAYLSIYHFIKDFLFNCDPNFISVPSWEFLYRHFEMNEGSESILVLLEKIKISPPYVGMDYIAILKEFVNQQNLTLFGNVLNNANKIASYGMEHKIDGKRKKLKGIDDALSYLNRQCIPIIFNGKSSVITEGDILSQKMLEMGSQDYHKMERNPMDSIGIPSWLQQMDDCTTGLKSGELMIVTAFTGHCKTTFALNQAYRALYGGWNTAFISLEMSFSELRDRIYVLHSCNPMFKVEHPEYAHLVGTIDYNNVRYGNLNDEEKKFYFDIVIEDFIDKREKKRYGKFYIWQPERTVTTLSDITMKLMGYQQECAIMDENLDFCVIDYISLLGADEHERSRDGNETVNNIVKNLKRLCLTFNEGRGIRVLSPHQSNRDGYKKAKDPSNEGIYDLTAISNNHEIERSADLVISVYKFEDRESLKICCLKNRRNKFFLPFEAGINFNTGFIYNNISNDLSEKINYKEILR